MLLVEPFAVDSTRVFIAHEGIQELSKTATEPRLGIAKQKAYFQPGAVETGGQAYLWVPAAAVKPGHGLGLKPWRRPLQARFSHAVPSQSPTISSITIFSARLRHGRIARLQNGGTTDGVIVAFTEGDFGCLDCSA